MIKFENTDHKYVNLSTGKNYISVSGLYKRFENQFDKEFHSYRSAIALLAENEYNSYKRINGWDNPNIIKDLRKYVDENELELLKNCFLDQWLEKGKRSTNRGTRIHEMLENLSYELGSRPNPETGEFQKVIKVEKKYDNQSLKENLYELEDGYYPELLVFNHDHKLAGQVDGCFISSKRGRKYVDLIDYKTDEKIRKVPKFFNRRTNSYEMLTGVLSHLTKCNFNTYSIKTSMYAHMLEEFGFILRSIYLYHIEFDKKGNYIGQNRIKLPYRKMECEMMLEEYSNVN